MALLTQWTWVWVNSGNWWWTGRPGMLLSMGSQRVAHDWATELTELRLVIAFLPRSKRLLISWLESPSVVILEVPQNKIFHCFHCLPIYLLWSDGTGCHDLSFSECWVLSQLPLSLSSRSSIVLLCFLPLEWCHLHMWDYWYFSW